MSINVNVNGNPICIKRGIMVTADPDFATKEFQKRRRIRLEQVRQQSKDIAANVRNKVQREKNKQLSDIEKLGENELKKWQARKLLVLQQQYQDCLKDIGLGHAQAILEEESDDALLEQQETYDQLRKERGKEALQRVKDDLTRKEEDRVDDNERRRYNQAVENARSSLVVKVVKNRIKSPFKKKKKKRINKNYGDFDDVYESGSEIDVPLNTLESQELSAPVILTTNMNTIDSDPLKSSDKEIQINLLPASTQELDSVARDSLLCPVDTRISDRIKKRRYRPAIYDLTNEATSYRAAFDSNSQRVPHAKFVDKEAQTTYRETQIPFKVSPTSYRVAPVINAFENPKPKIRSAHEGPHNQVELPFKPKLTLRTNEGCANEPCNKLSSGRKVQHYDHRNRFSKEYDAPASSVQRVNEDSIEVCPSVGSDVEFVETMYKRDRDALARGQRALEKVKVQHDYKEMMEQLPRLQKKERLASLTTNKPEFHMSEDRLKENKRKRQNRLENAYEQLFPQSHVVTIPPKQSLKGTIANLQDENVKSTRPMGRWDIDKPTPDPVIPSRNFESNLLKQTGEMLQDDSSTSAKKKESLQKMLKSLTEHRDKLAKELKSIPQTSHLHKVLGDLSSIDEVIESGRGLDKESIKEHRPKEVKQTKVPPKASTPSAAKRPETQSSKKPTKVIAPSRPYSSVPKPKPTTISAKKTPTPCEKKKESAGQSAKPRVYRYRCKYISDSREQSPGSRSTSPANQNQSEESSSSRQPSPSDKCRCRRSKDQAPDEKCECKEFYGRKSPVKDRKPVRHSVPPSKVTGKKTTDVGIEVLACTKDKGVGTSPSKKEVGREDNVADKNMECICGTTVKAPTETCEIVIKICDEGKHKISVSPAKQNVEKIGFDSNWGKVKFKPKLKSKSNTTWKECFSQNSTNSTSTSYYSPPEMLRPTQRPVSKRTSTAKTILRNKPQQRNINESSVVSTPRQCVKLDDRTLLTHIKQLLSMSRGSVDELAVSTVSDVSTPCSSVINIESNCGNDRLEHFLRHLKDLSQISSNSTAPSVIRNVPAQQGKVCYSTAVSTVDSTNCTSRSSPQDDTRNQTIDQYAAENYPEVLMAYNKMAESCAQKIENLAAMIENVRLEKIKMFEHSPSSDKENSTKYYDLPAPVSPRKCKCDSPEQVKLNEQLLEVKLDLEQDLNTAENTDISMDASSLNSTNQELLDRFNKLKGVNVKQNQDDHKCKTAKVVTASPIWLDIPRLPVFTTPQVLTDAGNSTRKKSKPPTSKGITVAKCYNRDIATFPHELSEIPEVDSFVSSKLQRSPKSNKSRLVSEDLKNRDAPSTNAREILKDNSDNVQVYDPKHSSSSVSIPDILSGIDTPIQVLNTEALKKKPVETHADKVVDTISILSQKTLVSDSSTNEMETIEAALKRLGMGWGVATIRKTQEALALASTSSSSIDITPVNDNINQVSLQTLCSSKDSSSTSALSIFLRGLVNSTQNPDTESSSNKTTRKTSTPVQATSYREEQINNSTQPNFIPTTESDISSIKHSSNDTDYDYMPFYSLNEVTANQTKDDNHP